MAERVEVRLDLIENIQNTLNEVNNKLNQTNDTVNRASSSLGKMSTTFFNLSNIMDVVGNAWGKVKAIVDETTEAYNIQNEAEQKLAVIMRQRTGATDEQIQSIKDLASAQQALGVIGDEVQLSGAQQLGTFVKETDTLKTLIPAMNNLLAQQKGLNATTDDAVNIGNLMGKVLQGQTAALTRVGISFDESQEKVLKYGTESERAAMLAQVITDNVGNMNETLAQTPEGKVQQTANNWGDMNERIGEAITRLKESLAPTVEKCLVVINKVLDVVLRNMPVITASISALAAGILAVIGFCNDWLPVIVGVTAAVGAYNLVVNAVLIKTKVVTLATQAWAKAQAILNVIMSLNPIGIVIAAITALIAIITVCWMKFDWFRAGVKTAWDTVKQFGVILKDYVIERVKGVISGLGAMGSAIARLFKGDFKGAIDTAKQGIKDLTGYESAANAIAKARNLVAGTGDRYRQQLAKERAQNGQKSNSAEGVLSSNPLANLANSNLGGSVEAPKSAQTKAEATVTGGTRNTNITINFDKEMVKMEFNGGYMDNLEQVESTIEEQMLRVLSMAKASI